MNEENSAKRVYLQIYDYETKEFSGLTTYHGLVRIFNSNTWPSRIFWCVVVLSCLSLFMIHSGYLLLGYHAKPTLFQINTHVAENGLPFPDVTVCNLNFMDFENTNLSKIEMEYILSYYKENPEELEPDVLKNIEPRMENVAEIKDLFKKHAKTCEQTFLSCKFGQTFENCCDVSTTEFTDYGLCFRFSGSGRKQFLSGEKFGWEFVMNGNNKGDEDSRGFLVLVHESGKFPRIDSNALSVPPGAKLHASVHLRNMTLLHRKNWGVCVNNWNDVGVKIPDNITYTGTHCESYFKLQKTIELCDCAPLYLTARFSNFSNICTPEKLVNCVANIEDDSDSKISHKCDSECDFFEFDILSSYSSISRKRLNFTKQYIDENISAATVFFRQIVYERHEQQKQLQTADLLSNIAGSMGLFLGMSTVTLLEIFIYLFKSVWGTVNSARQKQFMEAVAEEERERSQSVVIIQDEDEPQDEIESEMQTTRAFGRKQSTTPLHIHLDQRNTRVLRGGDLYSAPRGSVSIPSQLLSPLSNHRKSLSIAQLERRNSGAPFLQSTSSNQESHPPMRRSSTISPPTFSNRSKRGSVDFSQQRKTSTASVFKTQLL